jgi:peptidyl-tRNA hydrolase, PTH2 family
VEEIKQVIVARKDLNMRKGKLAAQVAHASIKVILDKMNKIPYSVMSHDYVTTKFVEYTLDIPINTALNKWLEGTFTKVVVGVNSEQELLDIEEKAKEKGILNAKIIDLGKTEFHGEPTVTCLAVGPNYSQEIDEITGHLKLL